jgi:hypothetical protein
MRSHWWQKWRRRQPAAVPDGIYAIPFVADSARSEELDPLWIDMSLITNWYLACKKSHPDCRPLAHLTDRPVWLIDVQEDCLVAAGSDAEYFALSYVWGGVPSLQTRQDNVNEHQVSGIFAKPQIRDQIPRTIRHAMALTAKLGGNYLWVDQLCICQDDEGMKHSQINAMGSIYSNAALTIVAATGWDANHGLRGIHGITEPRQLTGGNMTARDDYSVSLAVQNSIWVCMQLSALF